MAIPLCRTETHALWPSVLPPPKNPRAALTLSAQGVREQGVRDGVYRSYPTKQVVSRVEELLQLELNSKLREALMLMYTLACLHSCMVWVWVCVCVCMPRMTQVYVRGSVWVWASVCVGRCGYGHRCQCVSVCECVCVCVLSCVRWGLSMLVPILAQSHLAQCI